MKPNRRPNQGEPLTADFPLTTYPGILRKFKLPGGMFDPNGAWQMRWTIYSCIQGPQPIGTVAIRRGFGPVGGVSLRVNHTKQLMGGMRRLDALLHIGRREEPNSDIARLSAPRWWSFRADVLDAAGRPIPQTRLDRRLEVKNGKLEISTRQALSGEPAESLGGSTSSIELPTDTSNFTTRWALFDAVTRLAEQDSDVGRKPLYFTLIDHCDQIKPDQELSVRGKATVDFDGKPVELTAIDHLGRGIVPFTYWIDSSGRPLIISTGLEAYVLDLAVNV